MLGVKTILGAIFLGINTTYITRPRRGCKAYKSQPIMDKVVSEYLTPYYLVLGFYPLCVR